MGGFSLSKCYKNFAVRLDKCQGGWNNRDKKKGSKPNGLFHTKQFPSGDS